MYSIVAPKTLDFHGPREYSVGFFVFPPFFMPGVDQQSESVDVRTLAAGEYIISAQPESLPLVGRSNEGDNIYLAPGLGDVITVVGVEKEGMDMFHGVIVRDPDGEDVTLPFDVAAMLDLRQ